VKIGEHFVDFRVLLGQDLKSFAWCDSDCFSSQGENFFLIKSLPARQVKLNIDTFFVSDRLHRQHISRQLDSSGTDPQTPAFQMLTVFHFVSYQTVE
jgi:hypothetical protein